MAWQGAMRGDSVMTFGENLRKWRKQRGLSRQEMADKLNMTATAYGFYETNRTKPDTAKLVIIAKMLRVSTDELLGFNLDEFTRCKNVWESNGYQIDETLYGVIEIFFHPAIKYVRTKDGDVEVKKYDVLPISSKDEFIKLTCYAENQINKELCSLRKKILERITDAAEENVITAIEENGVRHYYSSKIKSAC